MTVLAWVLIVLAALVLGGWIIHWICMDPEEALFMLAMICAVGIVMGGVWGLGYICHWWGPLW